MTAQAAAPATSQNGTAVHDDDFPVDSFKDAAKHLRRPFTKAAVKFKVQATFPKDNPERGLIVAYIDARLAVERLNLVCPHLWFDEYQPVGNALICRLTVDGITRHDIGEGYQGKGLYSDAFKRAAVKFGVGVSLYAIPQTFLAAADGHLKPIGQGDRKSLVLTPNGETHCRDIYGMWLDNIGTRAFGEPLDHGDVEGSQGDAEAPEPIAEPADEVEPDLIETERAKLIAEAAKAAGQLDKLQLAAAHAHGEDVGDCSTVAKAAKALVVLTSAQADKVEQWLTRKATEATS